MPVGFLLKKVLLYLLYPSGVIFLLLLGVSFYALWGKRRGRRRALLFTALVLYYLASTPFLPYFLLRPLEAGFERPPLESLREVDYLVVLPARIYGAPGLYLEERFSRETLARWLAAVRLKKELLRAHLLLVGGSLEGPGSVYLAELSRECGIEAEFLDAPRDTISSVAALKDKLSGKRFVVITSAHHLRRALYLFRRVGLKPLPYPAVYLSHQSRFRPFHLIYLLPDPVYLELTNEAVHEYLGLAFYRIRDLLLRRET
ncbi:YdcF family protein [Thermosulfurimonas marina]|uniref:YdcF family protein n=1 Tax=Thermosulfurimonas marina TaxID=2047767 RepID=A0A6H1WS26_9BACT|nr:ElyC/SanA/YdcF family protein [Thermosulfurimonas marina]QJA05959.1 YdcF family protein [Thermosulfurimonas marina]